MNRVVSADRTEESRDLFPRPLLAALVLVGCAGSLGEGFGGGTGGSGGPGSGGAGPSSSGGAGGTGGSSPIGTGGMSSPACNAPVMVFKPTCAGMLCHDAGSQFGVFAVDSPDGALVDKPAALAGPCGGRKLVDTAAPEDSVLLARLKGTTCGTLMPYSFNPAAMPAIVLTSDQIECVNSWVLSKRR